MLHSEFGFVNGTYDGALMDGTPYTFKDDKSYIAAFSASLGRQFSFENQRDYQGYAIPYIGLGYRRLVNDTSDNPYGYARYSNYFYLPLGVQLEITKGQVMIQFQLEFDYLLHGTQKSKESDSVITTLDVENQQKNGYGANANLLFGRRHSLWTWLVGPYVRYWNLAKGDTDELGYYEPKNNTLEAGIMLRFVFS